MTIPEGDLLDRFLAHVAEKGVSLYPAQEEAILELFAGKNVILNTPTGSGKSLVATAMMFMALEEKRRAFYTCPIKALVSEKFFALCDDFGKDNVGMMTGDASVNRDAPIICCTAEILSNMALREGDRADVDYVVMDEFHYYSDKDRGTAWQIPLLALRDARFLLMSATLGGTDFFQEKLTALTGVETAVVKSAVRPVPLDYTYRETHLHESVLDLVRIGRSPIYVVCFTQRACAEEAQNLMSLDFCTKEEKKAIAEDLVGVRFDSPYGKEVQKFLRHGIGLHHAGLLPKYRLRVEKLAQKGHLKIICGTDTLGVGVNIPIRTVLFTKLCKYDGSKTGILSVRDFQQISGRAGRKGFDDKGSVAVQAPEHVIENMRMEQKAGEDKAKKRKIVKKKPPDRGYVHWDKTTFDKIVAGTPEPLVSRFQVSHGMLLNVLSREGGGCMAMGRLIRDSHERLAEKRIHGRTAAMLFRSLIDAKIISVEGRRVIINEDLQIEFSLNQTLSLYLLSTLDKLDPELGTHPLDVLTLVESILENPDLVLMKQVDRIKTLKMAEMKAAGVEYDERIAELDKLDYPKPNKDFIYDTFNAFAALHPWVKAENIRPKSVAREMYETFQSFSDYVKEYDLQRGEGMLLRYLSDVYKTLVQTVPEWAKTEEVADIIVYFGAIVRQVDSSLLDEWEGMKDKGRAIETRVLGSPRDADQAAEAGPFDVTKDARSFTVLVRNHVFSLLKAIAAKNWDAAAELCERLPDEEPWTTTRFETTMRAFFTDHPKLRVDPEARGPRYMRIDATGDPWVVEQTLLDFEEANDWFLVAAIDLARSREAGRPVVTLKRIGS